jgi:heptosyltransferase-1
MKIAIVKLSALGDIVHAMIVLQFIKKYNQKIEIDWVVEESYKELLEFNTDINKINVVNLRKAKKKKSIYLLLSELKKARKFGPYDLVIDLQGLIKSALISRLIRSPLTIGFDKSSIRERMASFFYNKTYKYEYKSNVIERNLAIVNFALGLSFSYQDIQNKIPFLYSNFNYSSNKLSTIKNNILLIPGASFQSKRYPVDKFVELTKLLDANFLIISGDSEEKDLANQIQAQSPNVAVLERLNIDSIISLISQIDLVIGSDTGPTHMAWALGIPSITLFGPTPGERNTFITNINRFLESDSKVNPYKINKNDFSIKNINVEEIVQLSCKLLNSWRK